MDSLLTDNGLILPRDDDPPFFNEFRIRHNNRVIARTWRQKQAARFRAGIRKLRRK